MISTPPLAPSWYSPLFALGFANAAMLWGLGAASIPIIIHLLNRRRFREVPWAAMRFLLAAIRKNQRRVRLEQWILLAVRTLLVMLLVGAVAKPFLESLGALPVIAGQRTHLVLVLDGSMSMSYAPAQTTTRFDQAKAVAAQLVKDARRGDAISLLVLGDPPRVVIGAPSPNHTEVQKELGEIALHHGAVDLTASFQAIERILDASTIPQKQIVFMTDLQATSWRSPRGSDDGLKRIVAKLEARKARSVVVDLGKIGSENRAVTRLALNSPVATQGSPTLARVAAKNFGPDPATGVKLRLMVDGQFGPEQLVDLPVGEEIAVDFSHVFTTPGDHLVEALIDDDPLGPDNHRWLTVPVRDSLRVLLVDGDFKADAFSSETDYLDNALNPAGGASPNDPPSLIKTEVVPDSQIARRDLTPYDVVVLCNVPQVTESEVSALSNYLRQGGGLIVFGGDQVLTDNFNRLLFANGRGLVPARIDGSVGDAAKKQDSFAFNPLGFQHPIVAMYAGTTDAVIAGLTGARTWQYHKLQLPAGSSARVALAFAGTNDPAVIESNSGRGVVFQLATSADSGWTSWPLHPSFPPIMEQLILQACVGKLRERNVQVGQPFDHALPPSGEEASATITRPDGRSTTTKTRNEGDLTRLVIEDTELSGNYQVKFGPPLASQTSFSANTDIAESDLTKLDREGLAQALPGWSFSYFTDWQSLTRNASAVSQRGELHRPFLIAVIVLLLLESILAWKFGHHAPRNA